MAGNIASYTIEAIQPGPYAFRVLKFTAKEAISTVHVCSAKTPLST